MTTNVPAPALRYAQLPLRRRVNRSRKRSATLAGSNSQSSSPERTIRSTSSKTRAAHDIRPSVARYETPPAGVPTPRTWGREERLRVELELHSPTARTDLAQVSLGPR